MSPSCVVWFKKDLRLEDNPAFIKACESGLSVIALYILDEDPSSRTLGGASKWWLHHALSDLQNSIQQKGGQLLLLKGHAKTCLDQVISSYDVKALYWNRSYEPDDIKRDSFLKDFYKKNGLEVQSFNGSQLFEPSTILTGQNGFYKVFTPFWKACLNAPTPKSPLLQKEAVINWKNVQRAHELEAFNLLPKNPNWASSFTSYWTPTRQGGLDLLKVFLEEKIKGYKVNRNCPSIDATSKLSPYLHFGQLSIHEVFHAARYQTVDNPFLTEDSACFLSELGWREFSAYLLYHAPHITNEPFVEKFKNFPWKHDEVLFKRWCKGETGYPIIDAGMNELWQTGWMHNRVRMIVASFLTKHLNISWQDGEEWFWDTLVDADLANNCCSWQWVAGCGADAAPYFRVFNPTLQAEKFDPHGKYIQKWLGNKYSSSKIVEHAPARLSALSRYANWKDIQ